MLLLSACRPAPESKSNHAYQDLTHYSQTFKRPKNYRLYLPHAYAENDTSRFPVIYFFHGWGGRYNSDDNAKLAYDSLQKLVDKYQVLLVMWDGNMDEKEPRPYNVGNHDDVKFAVQLNDYFPELIGHIDSTFRTRNEKWSRGIIGFSMGGFMSYFLGGKYPDKVGAAVAMTGSPEFFVGNPERHTLYPLRYTFDNLREVKLRFHNSTADELTYLNTEVKEGAQWNGGLSFDYWQFEGGHMVDLPGETRVFERAMAFVTEAFRQPLNTSEEWTHHDLYPQFDIYGYDVRSNMMRPGFISLKHVKPSGFGIETRKWLPDGPTMDSVKVEVTTPALYPPNALMHIVKLRSDIRVAAENNLRADAQGRLHFLLDGASYEIGISPAGSPYAGVIATDYTIPGKRRLLRPGNNTVSLVLLNRGSIQQDVTVTLTSTDSSISITPSTITLPAGKRIFDTGPFTVQCGKTAPTDAAPPFVRLRAVTTIVGGSNINEWAVPVLFDVPQFTSIAIDDNRAVNDSTQIRGSGNGNGVIESGERVVIYADGRPLKLYTDHHDVVALKEEVFDIMVPAKWPDGFTFASIVKIGDESLPGTELEFVGNYETKEFMPVKRTVHWGKVRVRVGKPLQ